MRPDPAYQPISAEEFLAMDFGTDRRFELNNGVIQMMTGGSAAHADVAGNVYFFLRTHLRGSGCRPFNSDMGVRVDDTTVRYPDVSVFCNRPDTDENRAALAFDDPVVLIEILSPGTATFDQGTKLAEYRGIASLQTIVFIDPVNRLTRTIQRVATNEWHDHSFAQPHDVALPSLGLVIPEADIFARD